MLDKISKFLFIFSGGVMFMLLGATALVYQDDIKKIVGKKENSEVQEKVEVLQTLESEGSKVKGDDFFSDEELKELAKDTSTVKIKIEKK
jgi:hypothetical protein